jgi:hypothetical protein
LDRQPYYFLGGGTSPKTHQNPPKPTNTQQKPPKPKTQNQNQTLNQNKKQAKLKYLAR